MSEFQDVSVKVPTDRLAEFYEWFGRWTRGRDDHGRAAPSAEPASWDPENDLDLAVTAWQSFPQRAQLVLGTLIDHPDRRYSGDELAEQHKIPHGKYGVAGTLAWPGRRLRKLGRALPLEAAENPGGGSLYWMSPRIARLWADARRVAES
jgi:hypothetical protein